MLENFNNIYKKTGISVPASREIINQYQSKVPELLIKLWEENGFGKYNKGIIELVNPKDFESVLWTWLGREVENYVPFAISGFGELFYYRKLTDTDEDVCMVDIQYRNVETLTWSLESFFEDFLTNETDRQTWLREELFILATELFEDLTIHEIFTISPALAMGGAAELGSLQKGNAQVYQEIIFQMTS